MDKISTAQDPRSASSGMKLSKVIRQKVNDNALSQTEFLDISRSSQLLPKFNTDSAVHPQLEKVEFYKKVINQSPDEISDFKTPRPNHQQGNAHTLKDILDNFKNGQICFTAQAGSGKTTLLKSITRDIIEEKYENFSGDQVVHFVNVRSFRRQDSISPAEFLFRNVVPEMSESEMKEAMKYAKENPDNVLFVIDGLDTISFTIDGVYCGITLEDRASPEAILYHLLAGNLIPGGRFITSSREYAIRNYKGDLQATQVIGLAGLTKESMKTIVVGYLGEKEATEIMAFLRRKAVIESLCTTPLWLVFTLMALKAKSNFEPSTMAGILVVALQSMIRSKHVDKKDIQCIIAKLTEMAFTGTTQRRVEFSEGELGDYDLNLGQIIDLMIATPSGGYQRLIHGDSILIYAHQCLQEVMTAFHIGKLEFKKFKAFIIKNINQPHFAIVRRLLVGILLNEEVFNEAENFLENGENFAEKKQFLKEILKQQLQSDLKEEDRLELYICLSEGGNALSDIARNNVRKFDFKQFSFLPSEMFSIGWVVSQHTFVDELIFRHYRFTPDLLSALYHAVEGSSVKLGMFFLTVEDLDPADVTLIAKIYKQCKIDVFDVSVSEFNSEALRAFLESSVGVRLRKFTVDGTVSGPEGWTLIAKIYKQCKVDVFDVSVEKFNSESLRAFLESSVGVRIRNFTVRNIDLGPEEMTLIAKICKQCKVDVFVVYARRLNSETLKAFLESSIGVRLEEFLVFGIDARGCEIGPGGMMLIAKICKQCKVHLLDVRGKYQLKSEELPLFLDSTLGSKIPTFNIGGVECTDNDARKVLGKIIKQRGVEKLCLHRLNDLDKIDVDAFKFSSGFFKIDILVIENLPPSVEETRMICCFLPYVVKQVHIFEAITDDSAVWESQKEILQNQLNEGENKDLRITFLTGGGRLTPGKQIPGKATKNDSPTIVKKRSARLVNDIIIVSWNDADEDGDVEYHVETFCDDQSTGEIMICKESQCKIESLSPSTAYCFKIWVVDSDGNAGQAMFTNEVVTCPSPVKNLQLGFVSGEISETGKSKGATVDVISKSFMEEITPKGGTITVGGCSIKFRPRTFTMPTKVTGKVVIGRRKWPSNYTGITALFYIYTENNLSMPAIVRMKSWCAPGLSKEGKAIMAHVLHLREDESWEVIEELPLNDEYVFQFECKNFSPVQVALKDENRGQEKYLIDSTIFTCRNTFSVVSHLHDDLLESKLEDKMKKRGFLPKIDFNPILVMLNDTIRVLLFCAAPQGFSFLPNEPLGFVVSENFLVKKYCLMNAVLDKNTTTQITERLKMRGRIENAEQVIIDGPHYFYYDWEKDTPADRETRAIQHRTNRQGELEPERPQDPTVETGVPAQQDSDQPTTSKNESNMGARLRKEVQTRNIISQHPVIVLEETKIRATWDKPEGDDSVTFCINIYCNDQLCENMPLRTPDTTTEYRNLRPSCKYRCEVWAVNSRDLESTKRWSNSVETSTTQSTSETEDARGKAQKTTTIINVGENATTGDLKVNIGDKGCVKVDKSITAAKYTGGHAQTEDTTYGEKNTVLQIKE